MTSLEQLLQRSKERFEYSYNTATAKDEIIRVMAEALQNHSCCQMCEPCPGCRNFDVLKKVEVLAKEALGCASLSSPEYSPRE